MICRSGYGQWTKSLTETDSRTKFITPAFVGEVDQLMVVVDKQEAQLVASRVTTEKLMDAAVEKLYKT